MEAVGMDGTKNQPALFNSDVETAIRSLAVLEAMYPRRCNLSELTWFDHVVVNTGDFVGGPSSLHPKVAVSTGEFLVRRHLVSEGLRILRLLHLVDELHENDGIFYEAGEEAPQFLSMLIVPYHAQLKIRAKWVAEKFHNMTTDQIEVEIRDTVGRWVSEVQVAVFPVGAQP
jgi:hypothetical protein